MENIKKRVTKKTAIWIEREYPLPLSDSTKIGYECSHCLTHWDGATNFCPYCGYLMVDLHKNRIVDLLKKIY